MIALVSDLVTLARPRATMQDLRLYDPDTVEAEYGVRPEQYTDFAALRGDPSDGLRGVKGIGPKTAARLLRDYGSVPGIYAALCDLPPKVEAMLRAGRDEVDRNLWLMAPIPNLDVDVAGAASTGVDLERLDAALAPLGLGRAAGQLRYAIERPSLPPMPPPPQEAPIVVPDPVIHDRAPVAVAEGEQESLF